MNAAAPRRHRVYVDRHHLAPRVEAGQQILAIAVCRLVAELGDYDGPVDRQVVDVASGKVPATAEFIVSPTQRGRQHMQLQLVAVRIRGLLEYGQVLAGHLVVIRIGVVVHVDHHHPGAHEAGVEVDVGIGDVTTLDARQPDDLAQPQVDLELRLHLRLGEARIAIAVEPAALGQDGGALAIHLYAPAFASQPALQIMGICLGADPLGHAPILLVLLLVAPAVEVEVHQPQLPLAIANEDAAGIPQPDVIQLGVDEAGVVLATELAGQRLFLFAAEHVHLGMGHHGLHQASYGGLHLLVIATPDVTAGTEGDPDPGLGPGLVRHMVAADGARLGLRGGGLGSRQGAQSGQRPHGDQLFQYLASG
ncbi:hypothetical protein D3C80_1140930 [compost metagenome]